MNTASGMAELPGRLLPKKPAAQTVFPAMLNPKGDKSEPGHVQPGQAQHDRHRKVALAGVFPSKVSISAAAIKAII